jgi:hypothetical protein
MIDVLMLPKAASCTSVLFDGSISGAAWWVTAQVLLELNTCRLKQATWYILVRVKGNKNE